MLEELLKFDKLGNKEELAFFLFDGLITSERQDILSLQKYCSSQIFSIARSFSGILSLCEFLSFVIIDNKTVQLNKEVFDPTLFIKENYFEEYHFYEKLFNSLKKLEVIESVFNENNLKFSTKQSQYYILENKLPYKFFPVRNLLLSISFFQREPNLVNHLLIKKEFTNRFRESFVRGLDLKKKTSKKISLEDLKKGIYEKEQVGRQAELFVLQYEHTKLKQHPTLERVIRVSEDFVNAGYDIESFIDCDSIVIDKFIEVKSYNGEIAFYWSRNEVEKSRELRDKYFLYLVDRSRITDMSYEPKKFQDPYKKIFESEFWKKETENWKITLES
ncbi:MAG: DUF3883 domain-containing protein [Ginsengibacter sp.]